MATQSLSPETEAIIARLKNEGDLIRNSGKNSIKQVNINLAKFSDSFKALNAAMANNTAVIKQASDAELKIQKEQAERARREGEIEELTQKDKLKAAELRAKADALRAKEELKDARGGGFFAKISKDSTMSTLKTLGVVAGGGFIASNLIVGVLDQVYGTGDDGWRSKLKKGFDDLSSGEGFDKIGDRVGTKIAEGVQKGLDDLNLEKVISDSVKSGLDSAMKEIGDYISNSWLPTVLSIGALGFSLAKPGAEAARQTGEIIRENQRIKGERKKFEREQKAKRDEARRQEKQARKDRANARTEAERNNAKQRERRARAKINGLNAEDLKATMIDVENRKKTSTPVSKQVLNKTIENTVEGLKAPRISALGAASLVYDVATVMQDSAIEQVSDAALLQFEKDRPGLKEFTTEVSASAAVGGVVGGIGTGGVGTLPGAGAGAIWGTASFLFRQALIAGKDAFTKYGIDALPNQVEKAVKAEMKAYEKGGSAEDLREVARKTLGVFDETIGNLTGDIGELDAQIAADNELLETGDFTKGPRGRYKNGNPNVIRKRMQEAIEKRNNLLLQLDSTQRLKQLTGDERAKYLPVEVGKVTDAIAEQVASAAGGAFVNTQLVQNTYNNQFVQNSRNNWNSGQVIIDNMTGGSSESVAMG